MNSIHQTLHCSHSKSSSTINPLMDPLSLFGSNPWLQAQCMAHAGSWLASRLALHGCGSRGPAYPLATQRWTCYGLRGWWRLGPHVPAQLIRRSSSVCHWLGTRRVLEHIKIITIVSESILFIYIYIYIDYWMYSERRRVTFTQGCLSDGYRLLWRKG